MKLPSLSLGRLALQGAVFGLSASIMVVIVSIVYAAASWGSLPTVNSGSGLTATSWNDLVTHVNQSVKQTSQVITVSGSNVGIGTASPGARLEIQNTITPANIYSVNVRTGGSSYGIDAESQGVNTGFANIGGYFAARNATDNYAIFVPNGYPAAGASNYQLYLASDSKSYFGGNVGIGTTSPGAKLDVTGGIRVNSLGTVISGFADGVNMGTWDALGYDSSGARIALGGYRPSQFSQVGIYTSGTEKLRIDAGGNVGIGTTSPTYKLDINGAVAIHSVVTSSLIGRIQMEDNLFHIITPAGKSWEFRDDGSLWFYNGASWVQKL